MILLYYDWLIKYNLQVINNNDDFFKKKTFLFLLSDFIRPICLPPSNLTRLESGSGVTIAGWGISKNGKSIYAKTLATKFLTTFYCIR